MRAEPTLSGTLRAKGDLARLDGRVTLVSPSAATAELTLSGLDSEPGWEARIEADEFDLSPWLDDSPIGPLSGVVAGRGSFERFGIDGHLAGPGLPTTGIDIGGQVERTADTLVLEALRIATPEERSVVTADGSLQFGDSPELQLRAEWRGLYWPIEGEPAVTSRKGMLAVRGWQAFDFDADAAVTLPAVPETRVRAAGLADRSGLTLTRARLEGPLGEAEGTGYVGFQAELPWQLDASVRRLDLGRLREGLDSRLALPGRGLRTRLRAGLGVGCAPRSRRRILPRLSRVRGGLRRARARTLPVP